MQLQDYKNIATLGICSVSLLACILHQYQLANELLRAFPLCMGVYFAVDLVANPSIEYRMHHTASLGIIGYLYFCQSNTSGVESLVYHFVKTEISTFFLVFRYYLPKGTTLYRINNYLFYASFAKFRIVDLYQNTIRPSAEIYTVLQLNAGLGKWIALAGCYTLYTLNLYWFTIINRHLYKDLCTYKRTQ